VADLASARGGGASAHCQSQVSAIFLTHLDRWACGLPRGFGGAGSRQAAGRIEAGKGRPLK